MGRKNFMKWVNTRKSKKGLSTDRRNTRHTTITECNGRESFKKKATMGHVTNNNSNEFLSKVSSGFSHRELVGYLG